MPKVDIRTDPPEPAPLPLVVSVIDPRRMLLFAEPKTATDETPGAAPLVTPEVLIFTFPVAAAPEAIPPTGVVPLIPLLVPIQTKPLSPPVDCAFKAAVPEKTAFPNKLPELFI